MYSKNARDQEASFSPAVIGMNLKNMYEVDD